MVEEESMSLELIAAHDSVKLIKFADDTTLIGLISNNGESAYRREVDRLVSWCSGNNLELNAQKTVEMIVDFRKSTVPPPPPSVMDSITSVESFRFLGTTITQDLKWEPTISSLIKKAQQRMYFLRQLRKAKLPAQMLVQFYTAIIESILTSSITVWFAGATVRDKQRLQRIVRSAEEVIGRSLPSLQDLQFLVNTNQRDRGNSERGEEMKACTRSSSSETSHWLAQLSSPWGPKRPFVVMSALIRFTAWCWWTHQTHPPDRCFQRPTMKA
uniref:Reverse transcriptase domain-containing protein n=1 Tax=Knipowitschia caucasica TaxID=637954 RepID=A0AAV2LZB7_KNICA